MATFYRTQTIEHPIGRTGRVSIKVTSSDGVLRGVAGEAARITANFQIRASSDEEADRLFGEAQLQVEQGDGYLRVSEPDGRPPLGGLVERIFSGRLVGEITTSATKLVDGKAKPCHDGVFGASPPVTVQ